MKSGEKRARQFDDAVNPAKEEKIASTGKTAGRKKIKIEYIPDKRRRQITFSRRKRGLVKKIMEIVTLTGAEALVILAPESGQVHTYATPKLQPIVEGKGGMQLIHSHLAPGSSAHPSPSVPTTGMSPPHQLGLSSLMAVSNDVVDEATAMVDLANIQRTFVGKWQSPATPGLRAAAAKLELPLGSSQGLLDTQAQAIEEFGMGHERSERSQDRVDSMISLHTPSPPSMPITDVLLPIVNIRGLFQPPEGGSDSPKQYELPLGMKVAGSSPYLRFFTAPGAGAEPFSESLRRTSETEGGIGASHGLRVHGL